MKYLRTFEDSVWRDRELQTINLYKKYMNTMTLEETIDYVINHCQDFINHPFKVLRSINNSTNNISSKNSINYFHSDPVNRFSRDDKNFHNLIIDNSIKWKNYPKRNKSFMCSLNNSNLGGNHYVVIPEDDSRWSILPSTDIYYAFNETIEKFTNQNMPIDRFFRYLEYTSDMYGIELSDINYKELKNNIELLEAAIKYAGSEKVHEFLKYFFENNDNIWKCILTILDPKLNGVELLTWNEIYSSYEDVSTNNEMWTDSPCVFVDYNNINDFIELLEKETGKKINL